MTEKEVQQVLDELNEIKPEQLEDNSKRLFEAIMLIADERDELKKELKKKDKQIERYQNMLVTNDLLHIKESQEKDEIRDLMANCIATNDSDLCQYLDMTMKCKYYAGENGKTCDECIKQYFENKAKEILNK